MDIKKPAYLHLLHGGHGYFTSVFTISMGFILVKFWEIHP